MANAGQTSNLVEPQLDHRRRITAITLIVIVIVSLLITVITEPYSRQDQKSYNIVDTEPHNVTDGESLSSANAEPYSSTESEGGNITSSLIWIGQIVISFIALFTSITELVGINIRELLFSQSAKTSVEEFPFHIFQDFDSLENYLFPDPKQPLIADRSIPYFPQISKQTDQAFQRTGKLLIRGRSKTGKTREACELLRRWWYSGPTVLVARRWL